MSDGTEGAPAGSITLFAFGTLMDEDVLAIVGDRPVGTFATEAACVPDRVRRAVRDDHYPVLVTAPGGRVDGLLIHDVDAIALERIAFFEGEEFALEPIRVTGERSGELEAMHFAHTDRKPIDEVAWTLEGWQVNTKPDTLRRIHRYMSHFGVLSVAEADAHW